MANNENTNLNNLGDNIPRRRPSITTYDLNNDLKRRLLIVEEYLISLLIL